MWPALAVGGATLLSGLIGGMSSSKAAKAQASTSKAAIAEQKKEFAAYQRMLAPYTTAGTTALSGMSDLLGLNGETAQNDAVSNIKNGSEYANLVSEGENALTQNAAATGGLRGGNLESSLANFRSDALSSLINQQYSRLSSLGSLGASAASGVGSAALQTGRGVASSLDTLGASNAGSALASGTAWSSIPNALLKSLGALSQSQSGKTEGVF